MGQDSRIPIIPHWIYLNNSVAIIVLESCQICFFFVLQPAKMNSFKIEFYLIEWCSCLPYMIYFVCHGFQKDHSKSTMTWWLTYVVYGVASLLFFMLQTIVHKVWQIKPETVYKFVRFASQKTCNKYFWKYFIEVMDFNKTTVSLWEQHGFQMCGIV